MYVFGNSFILAHKTQNHEAVNFSLFCDFQQFSHPPQLVIRLPAIICHKEKQNAIQVT